MSRTLIAPYCRYDVDQMTITELLVAEGTVFDPDVPLYEVEIDKTITEVTASAPGKLRKWLVAKGDIVSVGQPVAELESEAAVAADDAPARRAPARPAVQEERRSPSNDIATLSVEVGWSGVDAALRSTAADLSRHRLTTTAILAECLRQTLRHRAKLWKIQAGDGRRLNVSSLALGIAVAREDDELTTAVVDDALEHSADDFVQKVQSAITAARAGETKSLRNVPIVISDLSLYGIRSGVPIVVPPSIGTLLLGEAYSQSDTAATGAGGRRANLALSFDHRYINGVGAASLLADLKRRLETFVVAAETGATHRADIAMDVASNPLAGDSTREILHALLCGLLGVATVEPAVTLWSLGVDSRMAAALAARISERFRVDLLIHDIYENPTLLALQHLVLNEARPRIVSGGPLGPRVRHQPAPLTCRQEARWNDFQRLGMARNSRSAARALRLQGPLEVARLSHAVDALVSRHEALRTRIVAIEGTPRQVIDAPAPRRLEVIDLQHLTRTERDTAAGRLVEELVNEPLDMAKGPLFGARLLQLDRDDHVFAFAADHIVADRASADQMVREIQALYLDGAEGTSRSLPTVRVQPADYAVWQRAQREVWNQHHGAYWRERLYGADELQLPGLDPGGAATGAWDYVPVDFDGSLRKALHEFSRQERSTLALTVLTAYVALVLRWCNSHSMIVAVMTDGRARPEIQHTVGFFASDLYLRVQLGEKDSLRDLHRQITEEYGRALRHQDFGLLPALMPEARLAAIPSFNWYQADETSSMENGFGGSVRARPFPFSRELRELQAEGELSIFGGQPWVALTDDSERITGCMLYRPARFKEASMAALARGLGEVAGQLVEDPEGRVADFTPAF